MALSIKNKEFEDTARELARLTGKSITEAALVGLKRELDRQKNIRDITHSQSRVERALKLAENSAARPVIGKLSDDDVLGYDDIGAPTR